MHYPTQLQESVNPCCKKGSTCKSFNHRGTKLWTILNFQINYDSSNSTSFTSDVACVQMWLNQERWKLSSTPIVLRDFCVLFTWIQESKHKILVQTCGEVPLLSRYQKFEFSLNIQTKFVNNCNEILNVAIDVEQTFKCVGFRVGSLFTNY